MPGRRHATRGRRASKRQAPQAATPSMAEITVYGLLAGGIAAGLLVAADHPWWAAAGVMAGTLLALGVLALVAARSRRSPPAAGDDETPGRVTTPSPSTDDDTAETGVPQPGQRPGGRRRRHKR